MNPAYKKASFFERLLAYIIDGVIFVILYFIVLYLVSLLTKEESVYDLMGYILLAIYGALFIWKSGATPGKKLLRIQVVTTSYGAVNLGHALLRESIGKSISNLIFALGYFWMLLDEKHQTWHDKIANTFVVKLDKSGQFIPTAGNETVTKSRKLLFWCILLLNPISLATYFLVMYLFLFRPFQVIGNTMSPTLQEKEYVVTNIIGTRLRAPQRSDIIIFRAPDNPEKDYVKRVIGIPGDKVMLEGGFVHLNGQILDESTYLQPDVRTFGGAFAGEGQEITVPEGSYFVLGDNRPFSADSREWGFVPKKNIISTVMSCYWNCHKK